jgi:hypothetical protein
VLGIEFDVARQEMLGKLDRIDGAGADSGPELKRRHLVPGLGHKSSLSTYKLQFRWLYPNHVGR